MPAIKGALAIAGLTLLSWVYIRPGHPSVGPSLGLDALLHVGLFALVGAAWARHVGRSALATSAMLAIASLLEVLQWYRGDYAAVEYADIAWNLVGVLLGRWCIAWWSSRQTARSES